MDYSFISLIILLSTPLLTRCSDISTSTKNQTSPSLGALIKQDWIERMHNLRKQHDEIAPKLTKQIELVAKASTIPELLGFNTSIHDFDKQLANIDAQISKISRISYTFSSIDFNQEVYTPESFVEQLTTGDLQKFAALMGYHPSIVNQITDEASK